MEFLNFNNNVINADCLPYLKQIPDKFFDLAIVDPPYGINAPNLKMGSHPNRKKGGYSSVSTAVKVKGRLNSGGGKLKNRMLNKSLINWDNETPTTEYFNELFRVSKNQIIFGANYFNLPPSRCFICWDKLQPWENFSQFELAYTSFDKPAYMIKLSNTGGNNKEIKIHPTQKPVKLYDKILKKFAQPGIKVLDTHIGSGSIRISADKYGVNLLGFEKNQIHFNDQEQRFKNYKKQLRLNL